MQPSSHSLLHQAVSQIVDAYVNHADFVYDMHPSALPARRIRLAFELDLDEDTVLDAVAALPEELLPTARRIDDIIPADFDPEADITF